MYRSVDETAAVCTGKWCNYSIARTTAQEEQAAERQNLAILQEAGQVELTF